MNLSCHDNSFLKTFSHKNLEVIHSSICCTNHQKRSEVMRFKKINSKICIKRSLPRTLFYKSAGKWVGQNAPTLTCPTVEAGKTPDVSRCLEFIRARAYYVFLSRIHIRLQLWVTSVKLIKPQNSSSGQFFIKPKCPLPIK